MNTFKRSAYDFSVFPVYPQGFNNLRALKPLPESAYETFAQRNGLQYAGPRNFNNDWPGLQAFGIWLNSRLWSKMIWQFDGNHNGTPFTVACAGESRLASNYGTTSTHMTLAVIPLPRRLPQIAVYSLLPHLAAKNVDWGRQLAANQRVLSDNQLFNDYWAVYVPAAYAQAAQKTLLTEQFMDTLLQYATGFDIAIVDDKLYLLADGLPLFREGFMNLFTAVEAIIDALQAIPELPEVAAQAATTDIRLQTRHGVSRLFLRAALVTSAISMLLGGLVVAVLMGSSITSTAWGVLAVVIVLLLAGYFIVGPDRSLPKRPKSAQALIDRFGKVVVVDWRFTA